MSRERALDGLIGRLVEGEGLGDGADTSALGAIEAARMHALGRVFAGFSKLRDEGAAAPAPFAAHAAGDRAGAFRLVAPLGSGGMGEVWLAERCDGAVEQRVAIKYVRLARAGLAERFVREQRVLARLVHPGIARFLDAGRDASGAPYLVMEYVDGAPIDAWCDASALDVAARIDLFLDVCDAVDYAHRQLVVHRDIKPSNVLVAAGGAPTLLDFGVAKLLDDTGAETMQPALTLAYAAPEQCRGEAVSTATDVFSLGLVLFRLLARTLPASRREANLATLAAARDVESLAAAAPGVRELAGDLDAIVGKATRGDPRERYGSVAAFADDLRRYRAARPVRARAPTRTYRARKFIARHRLAVAASTVAVLALATGLGVALWQADVARRAADRADAESVRATRVADFLVRLFREQDPLARAGANARSPRELVADGVIRARSELADQPALRASLLGVLGEATMNLGDLDGGRKLIEEARSATPDGTSEAARLDGWLGGIAMRQGRQGTGSPLLESAIARLDAGTREDRLAAASLEYWRADMLIRAGKLESAIETMRRAHATLEAALGPDHLDTLEAETYLLAMLSQARHDDEAEPLARSLIERVERVAGPDSPRLIEVLNWSAQIQKRRDRHAEALAEFERAIALARRHLGPRHTMLAALYSRMANVEQDDGHLDKALAALDRANEALPDDAGIERAQMLATRGATLIDLGRADEAETSLREALELRRASSGDDDGLVWYSLSEWGRALNAQGRRAEAERAQTEALRRMEALMGPDAYHLTFVLRALAETYAASGAHAKAAQASKRALELASKKYPPTHAVVLQYRVDLAGALGDAGDTDAAFAESEAILASRDSRPELLQFYARAALVKARVLQKRGRRDEATAFAKQGLADLDRAGIAQGTTRRDLAALAGVSL